jgi:capsular polysaccharide biosynthesis protein
MTRRVVLHVLETFFRHPFVHTLPLIILLAFGVISAMGATKEYRSVGVLNATSGTLLSELTGESSSFGYESSANVTSRNINQLVSTRAFVEDIVERAGLETSVQEGLLTHDDIRQAISSWPQGDNLIAVAATTEWPEVSQRLATATLQGFVEYVVGNDIADANVRISTYESIRDENLERYNEALDELNAFVDSHPAGSEETRPISEQLDISRLQAAVSRAEEAYISAQGNVNDARLAADVARTVVERQLRIVDQPETPGVPVAGLRQAVFTVGVFGVLGLLLAVGIVVLASMLDRSVRAPGDVSSRLGVEVLATVPSARR